MGILKYLSELGGGDKPYIATLTLYENVDVEKGDILYFVEENNSVTNNRDISQQVVGVCAEDYKAEPSEFVPSYGTGKVSVILSQNALYRIPACIFESPYSGGRNVMMNHISTEFSIREGFAGSKLVLVEKAENSTNKQKIGTVTTIDSIVGDGGYIGFGIDVDMSGSAGDKYMFIPTYGFGLIVLDENGEIDVQFDRQGDFFVVDADKTGITVMLRNYR